VCAPADNDDIVTVAVPFASGAVSSDVEPSRKLTVPSGVPLLAATEALSVTAWPAVACTGDAVSRAVVSSAEGESGVLESLPQVKTVIENGGSE
jgi:hypothetical protein